MSCKRLLWSVGNLVRLRSSSYVSVVVLKTARRARSWMRSIFRPSEDLQKFQTKWQYVKCGIIAVLYNKSLAWHGIRLCKCMRTPTFWLALVHISLMCCVKLRFSSIFTPSSLICSVFMMSSLAMVGTLPFSMWGQYYFNSNLGSLSVCSCSCEDSIESTTTKSLFTIAEDLHCLKAVDRNFVRNGGTTPTHSSLCSWAGVSEQIANNVIFWLRLSENISKTVPSV